MRFIVCTECGNECEIETEFDGYVTGEEAESFGFWEVNEEARNGRRLKSARLCHIVTHDKQAITREVCPGSYMTFILDVEYEQQKLT